MQAARDVTLRLVQVKDATFFVLASWDDPEGFRVTVTDGSRSWSGEAVVDDRLKPRDMPASEYLSLVRKALSQDQDAAVAVATEGDRAMVSWKMGLADSGVALKGSLSLRACGTAAPVLECCARRIEKLQQTCGELSRDKEVLGEQYRSAEDHLKRLTESKERMEEDMYKAFCVVINQKKAKIRELREQIEDLRNAPPPAFEAGTRDEERDSEDEDEREEPVAGTGAAVATDGDDDGRLPNDDVTDPPPTFVSSMALTPSLDLLGPGDPFQRKRPVLVRKATSRVQTTVANVQAAVPTPSQVGNRSAPKMPVSPPPRKKTRTREPGSPDRRLEAMDAQALIDQGE